MTIRGNDVPGVVDSFWDGFFFFLFFLSFSFFLGLKTRKAPLREDGIYATVRKYTDTCSSSTRLNLPNYR